MKWYFWFWGIFTGIASIFLVDGSDNKLIMLGISTLLFGVFFILGEIDDLKDK